MFQLPDILFRPFIGFNFDLGPFFGSVIGGATSGLIALFIFWLGTKRDKKRELLRLDNLRRYFVHSINSLPIEVYITRIRIIAFNLLEDNTNLPTFSFPPDLNSTRLREVRSEDLFKIYLGSSEGSDESILSKINQSVENLDAQASVVNACFDELKKAEIRNKPIFDDSIEMAYQIIEGIINSRAKNLDAVAINIILTNWVRHNQDIDYREPIIANRDFLIPLLEICRTNNDPIFIQIARHIKNAQFALESWITARQYIRVTLLNAGIELVKIRRNLNKSI